VTSERPRRVDAPVDPEQCEHRAPDSLGVPGTGEILWCSQCGSICVVSQGHPHGWETPGRSRMGDS
jgi:hypothetical protein